MKRSDAIRRLNMKNKLRVVKSQVERLEDRIKELKQDLKKIEVSAYFDRKTLEIGICFSDLPNDKSSSLSSKALRKFVKNLENKKLDFHIENYGPEDGYDDISSSLIIHLKGELGYKV